MATAEEYAQWIVQNQAKKGTPEFETVARAYKAKRAEPQPPAPETAPTAPAAPEMSTWDKGVSIAKGAGKELLGQAAGLGARGMIAAQPFKSEDMDKAGEYIKHPGQMIGDIGSGLSKAATGATDFLTGLFHPGETPEELEKFGGRATQAVEGVAGAAGLTRSVLTAPSKVSSAIEGATSTVAKESERATAATEEARRAAVEDLKSEEVRRKAGIKGEYSSGLKQADAAAEAAKNEARDTEQRRMQQEIERAKSGTAAHRQTRETAKAAIPDEEGHSAASHAESGLPTVDESLGTKVRSRLIDVKKDALTVKEEGAGGEPGRKELYANYENRMRQLETGGEPFELSKSGIKFFKEIPAVKKLPPNASLTPFSERYRSAVLKLEKQLKGMTPEGAPEGATAPRVGKAIDEAMRDLEDIANNSSPMTQAERSVKQNARTLADKLKGALKDWVGEEYWPDEKFKKIAARANETNSELMRSATEQQDMAYVDAEKN